MNRRLASLTIATSIATFAAGGCASADPATEDEPKAQLSEASRRAKPTIILVHGAWADALGWEKVIDLLLEGGYAVTAVENPLTSLADDIVSTRRAIERETASGPVIVVGHSFGGAAITGAATGNPLVRALVYVNAFAPDAGETIGQIAAQYPSPLGTALVADAGGYLFIDRQKFRDVFCADVSAREAGAMAASQKPVFAEAFAERMATPAWRSLPTYYLIGTQDHAIPVQAQRFMAERMGAHSREINSSHASFASHPWAVVHMVEEAVAATSR
jgi:pimeloyl-ACP methyl ester carboxylesterase